MKTVQLEIKHHEQLRNLYKRKKVPFTIQDQVKIAVTAYLKCPEKYIKEYVAEMKVN